MNFLVRFKNPVFVLTFVTSLVAFVYQLMGMLGYVPPISKDMVIQLVGLLINVLTSLGIMVDPTTKGVSDSEQAMDYTTPQ